MSADSSPNIAELRDALRHGSQREGPRCNVAALDLLPSARGGDGRARLRADGVRGGVRRAVAVAAGVDEDTATSVRLSELLCEVLWITPHQESADAVSEVRYFVEGVRRLQRG